MRYIRVWLSCLLSHLALFWHHNQHCFEGIHNFKRRYLFPLHCIQSIVVTYIKWCHFLHHTEVNSVLRWTSKWTLDKLEEALNLTSQYFQPEDVQCPFGILPKNWFYLYMHFRLQSHLLTFQSYKQKRDACYMASSNILAIVLTITYQVILNKLF